MVPGSIDAITGGPDQHDPSRRGIAEAFPGGSVPTMWARGLRRAWLRRRHRGVQFGFHLPPLDPDPSAGHPDIPRTRRAPSPARPGTAVVIHAFYPELLPSLLNALRHLTSPFDLVVTNASGAQLDLADLPPACRSHQVYPVQNRGRDIFPLVQLLSAGVLDPYDLVLKLHTKRSAWRDEYDTKSRRGTVEAELLGGGAAWRDELVAGLLGSSDAHVWNVLKRFQEDDRLGLLTAPGSLLGIDFWGYNLDLATQLCERVGIRLRPSDLVFAAGSMYWVRASGLRRLRILRLSAADFPDEAGQTDGTTAHAVERLLGLLLVDQGLRLGQT